MGDRRWGERSNARAHFRYLLWLALVLLAAALLAACGPEDGRSRGGGLGASSTNIPPGGVEPRSKLFSEQRP